MQTTTNLGLKKPDYTDFADIKDINDNMDTLDTKVADVRDSKVTFTDSDLDSGITSFPTFLSKIVSGIKLAKFLRDFKAGMAYVLHVGNLVNNATCTESGKALDARMGKTLQDQITSLNDSLSHWIRNDVQDFNVARWYDAAGDIDHLYITFHLYNDYSYQLDVSASGIKFSRRVTSSSPWTNIWTK